jgi:hypothetical protein
MTDVLSEATADQQVIKSLLKYIRKLEGKMGKLLFDEKGQLYIAHQFDEITTDDIQAKVQQNQDEINMIVTIMDTAAKLSQPEVAPIVATEPSIPTEIATDPTLAVDSTVTPVEVMPTETVVEPTPAPIVLQ